MSDLRSRDEFLQLAAEALNFGDADQITQNDRHLRASLLLAYPADPDHSDPRWAGSIATATDGHTSVRAGTNDHTSVGVWLSDFWY